MSDRFAKLPLALNTSYLKPNITPEMISARARHIGLVDNLLRTGACRGGEFTGWLNPADINSPEEVRRLKSCASRLRQETDFLLVIGVGGSYLGARAVIEALADAPDRVVYAGQNISAHHTQQLRKRLAGKRVAINVISKSGTTTEPAIAFRLLRDLAGDAAGKRIVATTDSERGALLQLARQHGLETFVVPGNIGGRFSVLSPVGLLPIAYAGVDIESMIRGAGRCAELCKNPDPASNPAYYYAAARNILCQQGFCVEMLSAFEPRLAYFAEWWKQLFGESEGKENMAIFPASAIFTTDLHSLGQYIQEGRRFLLETFLMIDGGEPLLAVPAASDDSDGLNYLAGKELRYINSKAYEATAHAHRQGGVPNMTVTLEYLDEESLGALIYFFEISCAISGLMLGVNPFDQPGVEAYKKGMFELLEKPGYDRPDQGLAATECVSF